MNGKVNFCNTKKKIMEWRQYQIIDNSKDYVSLKKC